MVDENQTDWIFENEDTEVYFSFAFIESNEDEDSENKIIHFENFEDTNFSFNLNFIRPSFFGKEAFQFVEKFCNDLNLFVQNPQSELEEPVVFNFNDIYGCWNKTNTWASKKHYSKDDYCYLKEEITDKIWNYNSQRQNLQNKLGNNYFVPKIFIFKKLDDKSPITLFVWGEHLPILIPSTDYVLISKKYKKFFKTIEETVLISYDLFIENFGVELVDYDFSDCKIIHPNNAEKIKNKFNSIKSDLLLKDFAVILNIENLVNFKPN